MPRVLFLKNNDDCSNRNFHFVGRIVDEQDYCDALGCRQAVKRVIFSSMITNVCLVSAMSGGESMEYGARISTDGQTIFMNYLSATSDYLIVADEFDRQVDMTEELLNQLYGFVRWGDNGE